MKTEMACQDLQIYLSVLLSIKMVATPDWTRHFMHQNDGWEDASELRDV